jgi:hypothetical protein
MLNWRVIGLNVLKEKCKHTAKGTHHKKVKKKNQEYQHPDAYKKEREYFHKPLMGILGNFLVFFFADMHFLFKFLLFPFPGDSFRGFFVRSRAATGTFIFIEFGAAV